MEDNTQKNKNFSDNVINIIKNNRNIIIIILFLSFISLIGISYLGHYKENQNIKISEKFIQAGLLLQNNEKKESNNIYKEIIQSKNKAYSLLSLNNIIDNKLEKDQNEVLKLFNTIESIKLEQGQRDLVKLKKALYLIKISKNQEGNKLLNEIISTNSIWKNTALDILN